MNNQLPTALDGVSVTMNGKKAFVYYISSTQINVLTPPDLGPGPVQVQVTNGGLTSAAFTVQAQPYSLSFFIINGGPYLLAQHSDGALIGPTSLFPGASTPVAAGETIMAYANGFGETSQPIVSGSLTQGGILPVLPEVTVGGFAAQVTFAGLISPGLYQINFKIPDSAAAGDREIIAKLAGQTTLSGVLITVAPR